MNFTLDEMYAICKDRETEWPSRGPLYNKFIEYMSGLESEIKNNSEGLNIDQKINLNDKKIFIFGSMKSGTSLLLNILDGHPELACLPVDAHLLKHYCKDSSIDKNIFYSQIHSLWFRKLISPSGREPFLVFGNERDSYLKFSFYLRKMLESNLNGFNSFKIASEAYINSAGFFDGKDNLISVEKTPENEFSFELINENFKDSRYLHIVRDPIINYVSLKRNARNLNYGFNPVTAINSILKSMYVAKINSDNNKNYMALKYEDLTSDLDLFCDNIVNHLQISNSETLKTPTILGNKVRSNSMYKNLQNQSQVYSRDLIKDREKSLQQFDENDKRVFSSLHPEAIEIIKSFKYEI
jgi:hypothetical protein